jgi:hypothetical protein
MSILDDHFNQILASNKSKDETSFIPSKIFLGPKKGMYFSTGDRGTGYYIDKFYKKTTNSTDKVSLYF